ncbi:MAG: condensation domain-containing protein, partial [Cyclobacteriaceae bacterium]
MKRTKANIDIPSNLTQSQLLLWTGQELNPGVPLYNMALTFELKSAIDPKHFSHAFQILVDNCDAMRTVFLVADGIPQQRVRLNFNYQLLLLDWSKDPQAGVRLAKWVRDRSKKLLDISVCAFDSVLIKLADDRFVWYLNQHHLITDAWGVSVLYHSMAELYQKLLEGAHDDFPVLPSFRDYLKHEQSQQSNDGRDEIKTYWHEKISQLPATPRLYGHAEQVIGTIAKRITVDLGIERSNRLRELTQEHDLRAWTQHLALYNIFATVLFAYLYRVTGQQHLAIGTPAHNRPTPQFKQTPGVFIELFPLFAELEEGESFSTLLARVRAEVNGFLRYAQPGSTSASLNRCFHTVLNYIHAAFSDFNGIPMQSTWVHPDHCDPGHHLRLQVHDFDASGNIQLHFDLNAEVFDEPTRKAVPQHFLSLLDAFIEDRGQPIAKPAILTKWEYDHTINLLNKTTDKQPTLPTVIDSFVEQASRFAQEPAVFFGGQRLTYQVLDEKSNQLAHYLINNDVGPGQRIALYLKRSPELLIGIWGVLKAGAAYIPIAINYPRERV